MNNPLHAMNLWVSQTFLRLGYLAPLKLLALRPLRLLVGARCAGAAPAAAAPAAAAPAAATASSSWSTRSVLLWQVELG